MNTKSVMMRLAFREEGTMWNAYVAQAGTMQGAFLIGSIAIRPAAANIDIKNAFMELMRRVFETAVVDITGKPPGAWHEPTKAPESERSGNA